MNDNEKLLNEHGFKPFRQDMEDNIISWKKEIPDKNIEMYIVSNVPDRDTFDVCYTDNSEAESKGVWKTLYNDADSLDDAVEYSDNWLYEKGFVEDMDAVKPVFNAEPRKIAEEIDELERSIDGEEYDELFPDREAHIEEMAEQIRNGNTQFMNDYLHTFTLQEAEAEKKMAETLMKRLAEYDSHRAAYNHVATAAAEMAEEGNYNNIDGIIGNSAPKEHSRINIKEKIEENRKKLGLSGENTLVQEIEGQRNRG